MSKTAVVEGRDSSWAWLLVWAGLLGFAVGSSGAEKGASLKAARPKNVGNAEAAAKEKSVEALSELARPSVVVISHYGRDGKEDGVGSGFVISTNGLIATSLHVVGEARPITVELANGKRCEVTEIHAWDRRLDLAIIRVNVPGLAALPLGDSDALKQGAPVVAMGNPLGLQHSIVQGVVSARRELDGVEMIQLAIPIEPGNSGGPLLDRQGRVQGILTLKSAMTANLGFATPISALRLLLEKPNPVPMDRWLTLGALPPSEWTPLGGARWRQKAGAIQVEQPGDGFGGRSLCLSRENIPERPYELAVMVRLEEESGAAGLAFASDGEHQHYGFYPSNGQLRLTRFDGPNVFSWTILSQVSSPHYHPGEWNVLKVRVEKQKILCFVNGQLVIESEDDGLAGGKAGLAKFRDTKAAFRGFQMGKQTDLALPSISAEVETNITRQLRDLSAKDDAELIAAFRPQAEASQKILAERARHLETEAARLRKLAAAVHRQAVEANLVDVLAGPEERIDLFHAALLVAKLDNPDLEIEPYRRQIETMARALAASLPASAEGEKKLEAVIRYLFAENGFHGSRTDYYNRANSDISEVLDDREGLPITLSVLFLELSQRIGLKQVVGVPLPGHFVVRYAPETGESRWVDVFEGGQRLTEAQVGEIVAAYTGEAPTEKDFRPATKREIILRMLRNLSHATQNRGTAAGSLPYLDVILTLDPEGIANRLERARLRLQSGDAPGAKQDFKWLLDHAPAGVDLERIAEVYRTL